MLWFFHCTNSALRKFSLWWRVAPILSSFINDLLYAMQPLNFSYSRSQWDEGASVIPVHPKNSTNSSENVDHDVADTRRSTRNEELVKFIAGCIEENKNQGGGCMPRSRLRAGSILQRAKEQNRQDKIFAPMSEFAHDFMNNFDGLAGNLWKNPEGDCFDNWSRMRR